MKFKKITVACSSETSETVAYLLSESGSLGEVFDDYNDIRQVLNDKRWDYADASLFDASDNCSVCGFFTMETNEQLIIDKIKALRTLDWADFSSITDIDVDIIDSAEWENEWKKYYQPFTIGKITVIPEWITRNVAADEIPVMLNPGLAFGTGTHETTSMCIDLMQKITVKGKRILDFGCGSGILGICANALGASSVLFVDNDDQAITATEYNCGLNNFKNAQILQCDVRDIKEPADIVIANITADVLIAVQPIIKGALKKGGHAILSGIISAKANDVKDIYASDFKLIESEQKNEWSAFLFKL